MVAYSAPGISLRTGFTPGENGWGDEYNEDMLKLSALVQLRVLSRTIWPPADDSNSPGVAPGDMYIVPASDSNSAQDSNSDDDFGDIAVFHGPTGQGQWQFYTPLVGFIAYVVDEAQHYRFNGSTWVAWGDNALNIAYNAGSEGDSNSTQANVADALDDLYERIRNLSIGAVDATTVSYAHDVDSNSAVTTVADALDELFLRPYDVGMRFRGTELSQVVRFVTPRAFVIPVDFGGSVAYCATTDASDRVFNVYRNTTLIGTITFAGASNTGVFNANIDSNSGTVFAFAVGDRLGVELPAALGTMVDISVTFLAYRIN